MKQFFDETWIHLKLICQDIWQAILPVLIMIGAFLQPIHAILLAVGFFIFLDTVVARVRVYIQKKRNNLKLKNKKKLTKLEQDKASWTSRKMQLGFVGKSLVYNLAVLTFFLLDYALLNQFVHLFTTVDYLLTKGVAIVLIYTECLSLNESFKAIKGKGFLEYVMDIIRNVKKIRAKIGTINPGKKTEDDPEQPS